MNGGALEEYILQVNLFLKLVIYFRLHWAFVAECGLALVSARGGLLFTAELGLLSAAASLAAEHVLRARELGSAAVAPGMVARRMWDLPGRGKMCLPHWQVDSLSLSHQGSPFFKKFCY